MNLRKLYQWVQKTSKGWQGMSCHFQANVVVFSRAVVKAQSSQIRKIAGMGSGKAESQRRRLQRFVSQEINLERFFKVWTNSVIKEMKSKQVVMVVDETKLLNQLGVMVVGVVIQGRCIPLAWRVYRANCAQSYPREGQVGMIMGLLQQVQAGMPGSVKVRVLADRGIGTSPLLMRGVIALGWTFLFRVTKQSKLVLGNGSTVCFYDQVQAPGESYQAHGLVFKKRGRIAAHVRVLWRVGGQEPWALVTNDPALSGYEYAQRMWIEEAFRDLKSHGWQVEQAVGMLPERMARLWILLVVAYAWMLLLGRALIAHGLGTPPKKLPDGSTVRRWSLFREGRQAFISAAPSG